MVRSRIARRIAAVFAMALMITTGDIAAEATASPTHENLVIVDAMTAPDVVNAGELVAVDVRSSSTSGVAEVYVHGAYGRLRFEVAVAAGKGRLMLPAAVTQHGGLVTLESADQAVSMEILPGPVSALVAPLVGPRTIVANGADETLAVVLPIDRFGNQVADGTKTDITWEQPGDLVANAIGETANGMSWALIPSGEIAGATTVRATAATAIDDIVVRAAAVRIDEVPGAVRDIALASSETEGLADGRSVITLHTEELTDRFDNTLADGTLSQFIFDGPSGRGVVNGTVQNGAVHLELSAPTFPGELSGHLHIHGVSSNEITIDYESAIASFDARLEFIGEEAVLRVEHALDPSGAFVADGTSVFWGDLQTPLRRGRAEIWVPAALTDTTAPVEILGFRVTPEDLEQTLTSRIDRLDLERRNENP